MADINVSGRIKISTFQKDFIKKFPYLVPTLRMADGQGIDNSRTIASARAKAIGGDYKPSGEAELSINGSLLVSTFEKRFKDAFGIDCEICYKTAGGSIMRTNAANDKLTLIAANAAMKEAGHQVITL